MTYIIPENSENYDSRIYKAFFTPSETNSGKATGKYAIAFMDAVNALPQVVDRFEKIKVEAAITAYNALQRHTDELASISDELMARYNKAVSDYNVSNVENMINHLFDMDCSAYSFNRVKEALAAFNALSADEQAKVSKDKLMTKISDLAAAMGKEPNFDMTFEEHFPAEEPTPDPEPTPDGGLPVFAIILIAVGSVLAAGGIGFGVFMIIKKKRSVK